MARKSYYSGVTEMLLNELIYKGYAVKSRNTIKGGRYDPGSTVTGEEYEKWIQLAVRYLVQNHGGDASTERFKKVAENANGNYDSHFHTMIGILSSLECIPTTNLKTNVGWVIESICTNFSKCAKALFDRRKEAGNPRETLKINDEYDVQDLMYAILKLFFDDVRKEDYVASFLRRNSRVDLYLPEHEMYIELKMTRDGLSDKQIGDELSIDIVHYSKKCKSLVCFVYDPGSRLRNPDGIINDLESINIDGLETKVYISSS